MTAAARREYAATAPARRGAEGGGARLNDVEIVREGLYAATRGPSTALAPVPGAPIGDAHLALDRVESALRDLIDAADSLAVYPEGAFGFEELAEVLERAKKVLGVV